MEDEHVIDWDELQNGGGATQFLIVRVKNNYFYFHGVLTDRLESETYTLLRCSP